MAEAYIIKLKTTKVWIIHEIKGNSKILTFSSRVSFTGLPLCDQVNIGRGNPETSHSNFIFCPALAITFDKGATNAGASVGFRAVILNIFCYLSALQMSINF